MPLERTITSNILQWLNSIDGCLARKLHGSQYAISGDPDVYICYRGHFAQLECKQPRKEPTELQRIRLAEWRAAGAFTCVAHSLEEAKAELTPWMTAIDHELRLLEEVR